MLTSLKITSGQAWVRPKNNVRVQVRGQASHQVGYQVVGQVWHQVEGQGYLQVRNLIKVNMWAQLLAPQLGAS